MERLAVAVEQMLLGALALGLPGGDIARSLVRPEDFADPWHRDVYRVLAEDPGRDLVEVAAALRRRLGPRNADPVRLHDLIRHLPAAADAPGYAGMVIEASLRRQVAMTTVLIRACGVVDPWQGVDVRQTTAIVRDVVAGLRRRVQQLQCSCVPGSVAEAMDAPSGPDPAVDARRVQEWCLAADRMLSAAPAADVAAVRDLEKRFIASLFSHRSRILPWTDRIRPQWLTARDWAPVLSALQRRAELDQVLDVVSVCWDIQRASHTDGPGPGLATVHQGVEDSCWEDADHLGRRVAATLLRRASENAAASVRAAAANPALTVPDLLHTVEVMLQAIEWAAEPLTDQPLPEVQPAPPLPPPSLPGTTVSPPAIGW